MNAAFIRSCCLAFGAAALAAAALPARAEWPDKVIRIVVPFAAGGSTDLIARKIAEGLGQRLSANVIVENRPVSYTHLDVYKRQHLHGAPRLPLAAPACVCRALWRCWIGGGMGELARAVTAGCAGSRS